MKKSSRSPFCLWVVGISIILSVWIGAWYILLFSEYSLDWDKKASYGDLFSSISVLFSGLVFIAILITIYLQSKSLISTKVESDKQTFESKFFQMLNVHDRILNGISKNQKINGETININGRNWFRNLYIEYIKDYKKEWEKQLVLESEKVVINSYKTFFERNEPEIGHYFRHLYNIFKFIDNSSTKEKQFYINLLRAQLSSNELLLLFYNCVSEKGSKNFKPLIEKYAILEQIPDNLVDVELQLEHKHKSLYKSDAYEEK